MYSSRVLSLWHEVSPYKSEERLLEGISSDDQMCRTKGIDDHTMVEPPKPATQLSKARSKNLDFPGHLQGSCRAVAPAQLYQFP